MDNAKEMLEGFNAGYIIEKHRPELSKKLVNAVQGADMPFIEGFIAGTEEYSKERSRSKIINKLRDGLQQQKTKSTKGKDKDKGIDMDR